MNIFDVTDVGRLGDREVIEWMQEKGLLKRQVHCKRRNCRALMVLGKLTCTDGYRWRCPRKGCTGTRSVRDRSFAANSHLSFKTLLVLIYYWCFGVPLTATLGMLQLAEHTVVDWYQFLRDECSWKMLNDPVLLGGPDQIVEIDESVMIKRKYNRGAHREQHQRWVFGIYDRTKHIGFIQFVNNRDAATLIPIIQAHVLPGTMIYSDGWGAYNNLGQLGYGHEVVIHDQHFVDPVTGVHTNGVEAYWSRAKQKLKAVHGSRLHMIPSYLDEFMWRERYGLSSANTFHNMLALLAEHYS